MVGENRFHEESIKIFASCRELSSVGNPGQLSMQALLQIR